MPEVLSDRVSRKKLILASSVALSASAWLMTVVPSVEIYVFTKAATSLPMSVHCLGPNQTPRHGTLVTLRLKFHLIPINLKECRDAQLFPA